MTTRAAAIITNLALPVIADILHLIKRYVMLSNKSTILSNPIKRITVFNLASQDK